MIEQDFGASCAMLEQRVLDAFWAAAQSPRFSRIELLLEYTRLTILRPDAWENPPRVGEAKISKTECFSCQRIGRKLYAHRIIETQHGGSEHLRNRVALCFECHKRLHPWLTDADRDIGDRAHGFESVREVMENVTIVEGE